MKILRGKCKCGEDHINYNFYKFDWIVIGLIIAAIICFPLGCTHGMGKQKQIEMEKW